MVIKEINKRKTVGPGHSVCLGWEKCRRIKPNKNSVRFVSEVGFDCVYLIDVTRLSLTNAAKDTDKSEYDEQSF